MIIIFNCGGTFMEIYALVGRSGTGKSYKALHIAGMYDIEYIIDDGLLIKGTKVVAGTSAKREDTTIAAVKRAIFLEEEHRDNVEKAIKEYEPDKLLIIGTSEHMIQTIISRLKLGGEYKVIKIEDISSREEMEAALTARRQKGKHVIPVPTFEIKKDFSGYFLDSIRQRIKKDENEVMSYEKTVVRPTFSYLGKYDITPGALKTIAMHSAGEIKGIFKVTGADVDSSKNGITIKLSVILYLDEPLHKVSEEIALKVKESVEYMAGVNVIAVNIYVKNIRLQ